MEKTRIHVDNVSELAFLGLENIACVVAIRARGVPFLRHDDLNDDDDDDNGGGGGG